MGYRVNYSEATPGASTGRISSDAGELKKICISLVAALSYTL